MGAGVAGLGALGVRARSGTGRARRYCPLGKVCRGRGKGGGSGGAGSGGVRATGRGCAVPAGEGGPGARSRCELQPSTARRGPPGVLEPLPGSGAAGAAGPSAGAAASAFHPRQGGEARGVASPSCAARSGRGLPAGTPLPTSRGAANNFSPGPRPSRGSRAFVRAGEGPRGRGHIWEGVLARRPGPAGWFGVRKCAWNK